MALLKIKDFDPNYRDTFGGYDIKGLDVYSEVDDEKIGSVDDLLVDEGGYFRYFIVDLGFWGFGKKVLLPVGCAQVDSDGKHVYALGFTKDRAENLPEFSEDLKLDDSYEERVRGVYRSPVNSPVASQPVASRAAYGSGAPAQVAPGYQQVPAGYPETGQFPVGSQAVQPPARSSAYYDYQQDPQLYEMNEQRHSVLRRYEERLRTHRGRQTGQTR